MTAGEFNALGMGLREDILWEWAFLITIQKEEDHNLIFYAYAGFIIEVKRDTVSEGSELIRALTGEEFFERYRNFVPSIRDNFFIKAACQRIQREKIISYS